MDEIHPAGSCSVVCDGKDSYGELVAAGVYLYRLQAGPYSETKWRLLLK